MLYFLLWGKLSVSTVDFSDKYVSRPFYFSKLPLTFLNKKPKQKPEKKIKKDIPFSILSNKDPKDSFYFCYS